jgi:hypothetical protein
MEKTCETIEELIDYSVKWASKMDISGLYGRSRDGGSIALRSGGQEYNKQRYKLITITSVVIPREKRNQGLHAKFLQALDDLGCYGMRRHEGVYGESLEGWYNKNDYIADQNSFFKIVGDSF